MKILHIDDDEVICKITQAFLQKNGGYEVQSYLGVEQALAGIGEYKPDLILVDFMMPDMEGMQSLLNLNADMRLRDIPTVFVTGMDEADVKAKISVEISGYIKKPYDMNTLIERINEILVLK